MDQFEEELRKGDGNELRMKFCAAHSSTALAVNCFAWFRQTERLPYLTLLGRKGAKDVRFEVKLPIFRGGRHPNMDVWIDRDDEVIAIESKLTEYFEKKVPKFSTAYDRLTPPEYSDSYWWEVYEQAKKGTTQHLDIAQLVKHYFGLWTYRQKLTTQKNIRFLYLFWEPRDWGRFDVCKRHRSECEELEKATRRSSIPFMWLTYPELWRQWFDIPSLAGHARNLIERYDVDMS
ncbi:MAG TPA: hypothetical protein PLG17_06345 [Thermodesulfobacteriota bacterium]|nr:hypothetical protein [Thermodesulfobacteriota bacterium]